MRKTTWINTQVANATLHRVSFYNSNIKGIYEKAECKKIFLGKL